jgi:hypothetical protein
MHIPFFLVSQAPVDGARRKGIIEDQGHSSCDQGLGKALR